MRGGDDSETEQEGKKEQEEGSKEAAAGEANTGQVCGSGRRRPYFDFTHSPVGRTLPISSLRAKRAEGPRREVTSNQFTAHVLDFILLSTHNPQTKESLV